MAAVRAYASVPLRVRGVPIGSFCVAGTTERAFDPNAERVLRLLANAAEHELMLMADMELARSVLQSEHAKLRKLQAEADDFFDHSLIGKAKVSFDGRWLRVNETFCKMVGYTAAELQTLTFTDITPAEDHALDAIHMRRFAAGEIDQTQIDKRYIRKDGKEIWVKVRGVLRRPEWAGDAPYFLVSIEDISAQKEAEAALQALRQDLENRIEQRTAELDSLNERLLSVMTDSVAANRKLRERERELRHIIEMAPDAYVSIDEACLICAWNDQAERTFGWRQDEIIGRRLDDTLIPVRLRAGHRAGMVRAMADGTARALRERVEVPAVHKNGREIPVEVRMRMSESNGMKRVDAFMHDISDRLAFEAERQRVTAQLQLVADGVPALIAYFDESLRYQWTNRMYLDYLGLDPKAMLGKEAHYFFDEGSKQEMHLHLRRALTGETHTFEIARPKDGETRFLLVKLVPDVHREVVRGVFALTMDITERKQLELALSRDVTQDPLTGLLNRRGLFEALDDALVRHRAFEHPITVLLVDLDGFKTINDTHGHAAGDAVLAEVGRRLGKVPQAIAARLGGDEFVIIQGRNPGTDHAPHDLEIMVNACFDAPVSHKGAIIPVAGSLGTFRCHANERTTGEMLLLEADRSMYQQKRLRASANGDDITKRRPISVRAAPRQP